MLLTSKRENTESVQNEIWFLRIKLNFIIQEVMTKLFTPSEAQKFLNKLDDLISTIILKDTKIKTTHYKKGSVSWSQEVER